MPFPNKAVDFALPDEEFKEQLNKIFPKSPIKIEDSKNEFKTEKDSHSKYSVIAIRDVVPCLLFENHFKEKLLFMQLKENII